MSGCGDGDKGSAAIEAPPPSVVAIKAVMQPVESRVNGVDNMLYMKSSSTNDGSYSLTVTFALGTDPDINTVNVQNRVNLSEPQLPEEVKRQGLNVKKKSTAMLQVIALFSPKGAYDSLFLSNYATINVVDTLARVNGRWPRTISSRSRCRPRDARRRSWPPRCVR